MLPGLTDAGLAADFLSSACDADWTAPGRAVVGGLAKVQRLAGRSHVSRRREQIHGVADSEQPAILHRIVDRGRSDVGGCAPSRAIVLRRAMHQIAAAVSDHMHPVSKSNATVPGYQ